MAGIPRTLEEIDQRWFSALLGSAIAAIEVIPVGEGVGFAGRTALVYRELAPFVGVIRQVE